MASMEFVSGGARWSEVEAAACGGATRERERSREGGREREPRAAGWRLRQREAAAVGTCERRSWAVRVACGGGWAAALSGEEEQEHKVREG